MTTTSFVYVTSFTNSNGTGLRARFCDADERWLTAFGLPALPDGETFVPSTRSAGLTLRVKHPLRITYSIPVAGAGRAEILSWAVAPMTVREDDAGTMAAFKAAMGTAVPAAAPTTAAPASDDAGDDAGDPLADVE